MVYLCCELSRCYIYLKAQHIDSVPALKTEKLLISLVCSTPHPMEYTTHEVMPNFGGWDNYV